VLLYLIAERVVSVYKLHVTYFEARSNLKFVRRFRASVLNLWRAESASGGRNGAEYQAARDEVSRGVLRAIELARRFGVPCAYRSFPAPAVGGAIFDVNLFQAILYDPSHGGIPRHLINDAMVQLEGAAADELSSEKHRLLNPLNWIKESLVFVIRIPFMIIDASGFHVSKV
jgi:hypothetical protein